MRRGGALIAVALATVVASAQWSGGNLNANQDLPAYNAAPPHAPLAPLMSGKQLSGPNFAHAYQVAVYQMAGKIPAVLHQMPCYCRCDRAMGHNSLHSCFEGVHGAECSTCMKEAVYAYRQTRLGRTPVQIRAGIEKGEWMNVDLEKAAL